MGGRMRAGLTISTVGHLALLVWCFVTLPSTKIESTESVPVDVISDTELSQIMAGTKSAPKAQVPKPVVDKVAEENKPVKDAMLKVSDKPEIAPTADTPPPPDPKPEQKPDPKPEKTEAKPEKAAPPVDEVAEALKRDEAKKKEEAKKLADAKKREEAKKRLEAKKREEEQKYDPAKIESRLALLDKRAPQRQAALGATLSQTPTLGAATGSAMTLSVNELEALRSRLAECWDVPVGVRDARDLSVIVHIQFRRDGSLEADPMVVNRSSMPVFQVAAESALRAIRKCAPFSFMPPAKFEAWKELEVNFNPREMFGG
jgi:colicin import membrane protein